MKFKIFSILLFLSSFNFAQLDIEKEVFRGLEYCYNFRWGQANNEFSKLIDKYPDDPRGYHYKSTIYLWYYLSSKNTNDYKNFVKYSDLAIDKGENLLDKNPNDDIILYTIGTTYSCRAIVFAKAENFVDAAWASKKSEGYLSECLKINPKRADAYLGLGLYNFALGQIPSGFKWALSLAGIKGNKSLGIQYIKKAANEGYLSKTEASYYLSQIYSEVINNYEAAAGCLKQMLKKYPDNLLFNYSMAIVEIKRKNPLQAEKIISKIIKSNESNFKELIYFSNFLMGDVNYKLNKFEEAKEYYQNFLKSNNQKDYKGIASYRLGVCYEITGDRNTAVNYFSQSGKGNMDLDDDIYAKRMGEIYAKRTMALGETDLLKISNLTEQGKYKEAVNQLIQLYSTVKTDRLRAEINYYLSEASFYAGSYEDASRFANLAIGYNGSDETWVKPFSGYYLAKSYKQKGKNEEALKIINQTEDNNNFDYQNKLKNLLTALRSEIEQD
jgi:tetratricopeptide (TPR) repeat protein